MSVPRTASAVSPFIVRSAARTARRIPSSIYYRHPPAVAIILPPRRRLLSTNTSTSTGGSSDFPPPGFNSEQAKQPIRNEKRQHQQSTEAKEIEEESPEQLAKSRSAAPAAAAQEPTSHPKTDAEEQRSLSELAADKAKKEAATTDPDKKAEKKKEESKNLTVWQKVKKEANHYWDGTKLLWTESKISFKLALKMWAGYELTRREHRQFQRTVQDLGRLVPFSVFVIVPLGEFLLPVALKLFPNLLPSTYEGQKSKDTKAKNLRATRKEVSSFLRQTLRETGLPVSAVNTQREEFIEFFRKVRSTGETPTASDVIKVCKLFKDDLTLDNLSRPQLVAICRYMNLSTFGTDAMLRYNVRHRMRQIKRDDKAISYEGVDSLSVPELQSAAASRGLRTYGASPGRLRDDLQMWLDLRLRYGVPSTLLVLSNAFVYAQGKETELSSQIDALQAVLASVPEELFHEIELEVHTAEGAATNKQRLEVLKEQQELIEDEVSQGKSEEESGRSTPKDDQYIDDNEDKPEEDKNEVEERKAA